MLNRLHLRPLKEHDHAGVQALFARQGWPQRSLAGWRWALFDTPPRQDCEAPSGWVLESQEGIAGFLGNLPQRLWHAGQPLPAATCTALLVDTHWRGQGSALLRAFSTQAGAQLLYSATANALSAPLYQLFRYQLRREEGLNVALRWVADSGAFASHALRLQLQRQGWLAHAAALPGPQPALQPAGQPRPSIARRWLRPLLAAAGWPAAPAVHQGHTHAPRVQRWLPQASALHGPDPCALRAQWHAWWARMLAAHPGLLADRQQDTLAWRLADPDLANNLAAWLLHDAHGEMLGLALARAVAPAAHAAPRAELLDWCLLPHTTLAAQAALLAAVGDWAAQRSLPFVEARRYSGLALQQLANLGGRAVVLPDQANWTLAVPQTPPDMASSWSMSGIDSDDWFCSHQYAARTQPATQQLAAVQ